MTQLLFENSGKKLKDLQYSLEIDEEGFPIFSGLRVNDNEILKMIFANMQRCVSGDNKSKLVTCVGKSDWAWVDAFDEVFVIQSIKWEQPEELILRTVGNLDFNISPQDLEVDEWDRLHTYLGAYRIPAVFSRKAQASFLNRWIQFNPQFQIKDYRKPKNNPSTENMWNEAYQNNNTGWELGQHHPYLETFLKSTKCKALFSSISPQSKILVPGAGRGHDAIFLAQHTGAEVIAYDFSDEAHKEFDILYKNRFSNLKYIQEDVFKVLEKTPDASIDAVFEHTFFCAISPLDRIKYINEMTRVLKPNGYWFGVFFLLEREDGPPFSLTQWELREFTKESFSIKAWERISNSPPQRIHKELWAVLSKNV